MEYKIGTYPCIRWVELRAVLGVRDRHTPAGPPVHLPRQTVHQLCGDQQVRAPLGRARGLEHTSGKIDRNSAKNAMATLG